MQPSTVKIFINRSSETGNWYAKVNHEDAHQKEIIFFQRDEKPGIWQTLTDFVTGVKAGEVMARKYLTELGIDPESEFNIAGAPKPDTTALTNESLNEVFQYASKRLSAGLSLQHTGAPGPRFIPEKQETVEVTINNIATTHEPFESQQAYKNRIAGNIKEILQEANYEFNEAEMNKAVGIGIDVDELIRPKISLAEMHKAYSFLKDLSNRAKSKELNKAIYFLIDALEEKIWSSRNVFQKSVLEGYRHDPNEQPFKLDESTPEDWRAKLDLIFDVSEKIADVQKLRAEGQAKATFNMLRDAVWEFEHPNGKLRTDKYVYLAEKPLADLKQRLATCKALLKSPT